MSERKPKAKFHKGQVVAFRSPDGRWEYDIIEELTPMRVKESNESAFLGRETIRLQTQHLRSLTKREAGR